MDLWGLTIAALRRWYILIPLLALSAAGAYAMGSRVQAEYEVSGTVMLVVPPQTTPNPYADDYATEILGIGLSSSSTREAFLGEGLSPAYEVTFDRGSPILSMRVTAANEALAIQTAEEVYNRLDEALDDGQSGRRVPPQSRVDLAIVDAPDVAEPVVTGRLRIMAVVGLFGGIVSLLCAVVADVILMRRRERRAGAATREPAPSAQKPPVPEATPQAAVRPAPAPTKPASAVTRSGSAVTRPGSAVTKPAPAVTHPEPAVTHPEPAVTHPEPAVTQPAAAAAKPAPAAAKPAPAAAKRAPAVAKSQTAGKKPRNASRERRRTSSKS